MLVMDASANHRYLKNINVLFLYVKPSIKCCDSERLEKMFWLKISGLFATDTTSDRKITGANIQHVFSLIKINVVGGKSSGDYRRGREYSIWFILITPKKPWNLIDNVSQVIIS